MSSNRSTLPIIDALPALEAALGSSACVLLEAPPGAGKSTYLPLWLRTRGAGSSQRVILIQPRRLAAASIAAYLARQSGETIGKLVGLRTRFDHKISSETVIEVVTEGVFLRQIQRDPELVGVRYVLFDEYHERSWQADLALGLTRETQLHWRNPEQPLQAIVMSATLPAAAIAGWLDVPMVRARGRSFPIAVEYRPVRGDARGDNSEHIAAEIRRALREGARRVLVFLAGWQPMQRVKQQLEGGANEIVMLHSSVSPEQQQRALMYDDDAVPSIILATNIAETSLTIPGVDTVIDSGQVRRARFDSRRGMDLLETGWISRASAEQRAGRAGRLGPGRCIRLWSNEQQARLLPHDPAEIQQVDLAPLALELALWGGDDIAQVLPELPPAQRLNEARILLRQLCALDENFRITARGRTMAELGLHPRLACLVLRGTELQQIEATSLLAALLSEGDFLAGNDLPVDLDWRLHILRRREQGVALQRGAMQRIHQLAQQLQRRGRNANSPESENEIGAGELLLSAFPDRVARRRDANSARYLGIDGFEMRLPESDALCKHEWIIVAEHDGEPRGARVRLAAAIDAQSVAKQLADQIVDSDIIEWNEERAMLSARHQRMLGAILLDETIFAIDDERANAMWLRLLREHGLAWLQLSAAVEQWLLRVRWLQNKNTEWPDFCEAALLADLEGWLLPYLHGIRKLSELRALDFGAMLNTRLSYEQQQQLQREAPSHFELPSGTRQMLEYRDNAVPKLSARMTEFYGLDVHPRLAGEPLLLELLSPSRQPLQLTADLSHFWRSSYVEVRKEMKGRYPKHFWPEQPWSAPATTTTKRHMKSLSN